MKNWVQYFVILNSIFITQSRQLCGKAHFAPKLDQIDPKLNKKILNTNPNPENFQISNGLEAIPHSWPWQVSLLRQSGLQWVHCCGGSLISSRLVLTAAHCTVYSLDPKDYKIMLGVHDKSIPEPFTFLMDIVKITLAPGNNWNKQLWPQDIAIITLSEETRFTQEIVPVCLPFETDFKTDSLCYVTGWGKTDNDQKLTTNVLMQAGVFLRVNCTTDDTHAEQFDPETMVCAGNGNKDTCSGDSGGPLVCQSDDDKWYLYGITSHGFDMNCGRNRPGVYSKVGFYKSMILSALNESQLDASENFAFD